jgi:hypothetical protein
MGTFDAALRLLVCPSCSAPLEVPASGGTTRCEYCGQSSMFSPRPRAATPDHGDVDEHQRLERLRAQQGRDEPPPKAVEPFLQGRLEGARLAEAEAALQSARRGGPGEPRDAHVQWLTVALFNAYAGPEHATRQRALLESAAEDLARSPRRAILYGMLARNAARAGELDAAEAWLARLDPRSSILVQDSAYRFSRAYIDTARGEFEAVLDGLGHDVLDVPLAAGDTLLCVVLRANAHERLGRDTTAGGHLGAYMKQSPVYRTLIERIIAANPTLALCPQSIQLARKVLDG